MECQRFVKLVYISYSEQIWLRIFQLIKAWGKAVGFTTAVVASLKISSNQNTYSFKMV